MYDILCPNALKRFATDACVKKPAGCADLASEKGTGVTFH
jgi:hypothetical protein